MKNEIFEKKICENCTHYLPHYIKYEGRYRLTSGHCTNKKPSGHFRKTDKICECYEQRDLIKERESDMKSATEWLSFIAERLDSLTQILKNEN